MDTRSTPAGAYAFPYLASSCTLMQLSNFNGKSRILLPLDSSRNDDVEKRPPSTTPEANPVFRICSV